ncbi:MAG: DegT/DnrJ/EryC1/StrS family aminotransferase [Planctomycetota bacterium]|nr:DegT/DnrJ/EryC1/StrS family aminotransferase [Planctomycetota bacterium]MED5400688.1 DegT/DnrJ/EryC1/StrS family aminotransferase [Planctomycetota bacterium]MEE3367039.1 DegT/DnrJ/EryC1/StrS family aminotransferase [Planctomycetota bacterium]
MDSPKPVALPPVPFIDLSAQHQPIADELLAAVSRVLENGQFILGEEVAALEADIASFCDSRYAISCASGTDALVLSLMSLGIGPGDEVITSPFTFFATAGAIHRVGATPVFVDIESDGFNICPELAAAAITENTKAIIPVHLFGQTADMEPLWRLAVLHDIPLIEDACQAIGARYQGRQAGVLGTMGCFSFFPTKNLGGAGDGGIITLDDKELATRLTHLRVHGDVGGYNHVAVGFNSRLDALQAAILRIKLTRLEEWTEQRIESAAHYDRLIDAQGLGDWITRPDVDDTFRHVYNQYTIRVPAFERDKILGSLRDDGIGCALYYPTPLHLQPCFESLGYSIGSLPHAEAAAAEVISLPIAPGIDAVSRERVIARLVAACESQVSWSNRRAA